MSIRAAMFASIVLISIKAQSAEVLHIAAEALSSTEIIIDGMLDEPVWSGLEGYDSMSVVAPDTLEKARYPTTTRIFYTEEGLYIGTQAQQPVETLLPRLSSRDGEVNRDGINFYLDPTGEGLYGYYFGVNLGGTLNDGTLLPERQLSRLWDGPWYGAARPSPNGYQVEMFLPWSMMAMPEQDGPRDMAFALTRRVAHIDETWGWPELPESKPDFVSSFQPMVLGNVRPGRQLVFYPFTAVTRDRIDGDTEYRAGADLFWRPTTDLQFTATLNPDFGAVESDDVIVNLTAFETYFPEKRSFFLEGSEIFITSPRSVIRGTDASKGARSVPNSFFLQPTTMLNTRRIGGAPRSPDIPEGLSIADTELSQRSELQGAVKVTGQKGAFRYGTLWASEEDVVFRAMDADMGEVKLQQSGRDFGVIRALYEADTTGRKAVGFMSTLVRYPDSDAITHGVDLHYRTPDSKVIWDAQLLYSDVSDVTGKGGYFDVNYIPRQGRLHRFSFDYLDDQLEINNLGFIRRNDVITYRYTYNRTNSDHPRYRQTFQGLTLSHETNTDDRVVRSSIYYRNTLVLENSSQFTTTALYRPPQWDDRTTKGNGDYRTSAGGILEFEYGTDTSRKISASFASSAMLEQLGGVTFSAKGGITYKPVDRLSFDLDFIYRRTDDWLIHLDSNVLGTYDARQWQPSVAAEFFITAKQQLRFSMQWVGIQADAQNLYRVPDGGGDLIRLTNGIAGPDYDFTISRLTAQLRYRWEIAPLSDLFIVYTRGSNLPNRGDDSFDQLFRDALTEPVVDRLVVKFRYRLSY